MTTDFEASAQSLTAATQRVHLRRIMLAWFIGAGWMALTGGAVFYRYADEMGLGRFPFAWGLLSSMPFIATFFQLAGSMWAERTGRNKLIFFVGLLIQRLLWLAAALLPFLVVRYSVAAIVSVLFIFFLQSAGGNLGTPPWTTWMADIIPAESRGRYFAMRHRLAMTMFVAVALLSGWLLNAAQSSRTLLRVPWPTSWHAWAWRGFPFPLTTLGLCTVLFAVGAVMGVADVLFFVRIPETRGRPAAAPPSLRQLLATPLRDRHFVRFLTFYSLFTLGAPGTVYYIWHNATSYLGVSNLGAQVMLVVLPAAGELTFAPIWGRLIDRFGRKTVWRIAFAYIVVLPVCWLFVLPHYWWLGMAIPILGNICWNGADQCNFNWLLHLASGEEGSSSYQAVFALAVAVAGTLSGLLLGLLASLSVDLHLQVGPFSFNNLLVVFSAATAIRAVAYLALLPRIHDESRRPVTQAIRYTMVLVFNAINSTVNLPLRLFRLSGRSDKPAEDDEEIGPGHS